MISWEAWAGWIERRRLAAQVLSPSQERVAETIAGLKEAEGFALASGAALIVRGDVRRQAVERLETVDPTPGVPAARAGSLASIAPPAARSRARPTSTTAATT